MKLLNIIIGLNLLCGMNQIALAQEVNEKNPAQLYLGLGVVKNSFEGNSIVAQDKNFNFEVYSLRPTQKYKDIFLGFSAKLNSPVIENKTNGILFDKDEEIRLSMGHFFVLLGYKITDSFFVSTELGLTNIEAESTISKSEYSPLGMGASVVWEVKEGWGLKTSYSFAESYGKIRENTTTLRVHSMSISIVKNIMR